jgi:hypothetical protein
VDNLALQSGDLTPYSVNLVYNGSSSVELIERHLGFSDRFYRLYGLFIDQRFVLPDGTLVTYDE